jgi:hypothetical protein
MAKGMKCKKLMKAAEKVTALNAFEPLVIDYSLDYNLVHLLVFICA